MSDTQIEYDVVILGAGIAGMGAAWKAKSEGLRFAVFEAGERAGGVLQSQMVDGHLLDYGANSCATSPQYLEFLAHLGVQDQLVEATAASKRRFLWQAPGIRAVGGLKDLLFADWISGRGKRQLFSEPFKPRGTADDESVSEFLSRRIGEEATKKLVDPVLGGIYAGDITTLSAWAVMEKLKSGEQRFGSLLKTMFKQPPIPRKISNLKGGMGSLGEAFSKVYKAELHTGRQVTRIERAANGHSAQRWRVHFSDGTQVSAATVVSALPSPVLPSVLEEKSVAALLKTIEYAPLRVDYFEIGAELLPVEGFGILVPSVLGKSVRGVLMGSVAFEGRAPKGVHTITVFSNAKDTAQVEQELRALLGTERVRCLGTRNWSQAIPQFTLGYPQWKKSLEEALPEGLLLAGNYLGKVGVADVLSSGYDLNLRP